MGEADERKGEKVMIQFVSYLSSYYTIKRPFRSAVLKMGFRILLSGSGVDGGVRSCPIG